MRTPCGCGRLRREIRRLEGLPDGSHGTTPRSKANHPHHPDQPAWQNPKTKDGKTEESSDGTEEDSALCPARGFSTWGFFSTVTKRSCITVWATVKYTNCQADRIWKGLHYYPYLEGRTRKRRFAHAPRPRKSRGKLPRQRESIGFNRTKRRICLLKDQSIRPTSGFCLGFVLGRSGDHRQPFAKTNRPSRAD